MIWGYHYFRKHLYGCVGLGFSCKNPVVQPAGVTSYSPRSFARSRPLSNGSSACNGRFKSQGGHPWKMESKTITHSIHGTGIFTYMYHRNGDFYDTYTVSKDTIHEWYGL